MPQIIATVKFEFEVQGPVKEAQQRIREQISSDGNEYCQADDKRAQLKRWEIVKWKVIDMNFKQGRTIVWGKEDTKILKDNYYKLSKEEMMKLLPGRSWSAILGKAYRLGL